MEKKYAYNTEDESIPAQSKASKKQSSPQVVS